jgi:uncharacterized protein YjbI with pentapeptide repeats
MPDDVASNPDVPDVPGEVEQEPTGGQILEQLFLYNVEKWNQRRKDRPDEIVTVNGINLSGQNLEEIDFHGVRFLGRTDFSHACLRKANFRNAAFGHPDTFFIEVDARNADFREAKLGSVVFCEANLGAANFNDANMVLAKLQKANLAGATLYRAILDRADLTGAKGLDPEALATAYIPMAPRVSIRS